MGRSRFWRQAALTASLALPAAAPAQHWSLAPRPFLVIGGDADPSVEFTRVTSLVRLSDGRVVVADGGAKEVRLFSAAGRVLHSFGRVGQGPGEFMSVGSLIASADTLFLADWINKRITPYLVDGTLLGARRMTDVRVSVIGRLSDGRWIVSTGFTPTLEGPQRLYQDTLHLGWLGPDASGAVHWLGAFPGTAFFVYNPANQSHGLAVGSAPLGPERVAGVSGDRVLVGSTGSSAVEVFDAGGRAESITLPLAPVALSDSDIATVRNAALAEQRDDFGRRFVTALFGGENLPRNRPLYQALIAGVHGETWIIPFSGLPQQETYVVVDRAGRVIGRAGVPPHFKLLQAGRDFLLGVATDELGVEQVQEYRLDRGHQ
jgi:hypothetical protein